MLNVCAWENVTCSLSFNRQNPKQDFISLSSDQLPGSHACCRFIKLRQTFTSIFVFSASSPLLGVYLKERNHVPETTA